ncbi:MAG: T9SS type A sorting domain-containing protein [Flavipsychrobacter sp.]
MKKKESNLKLFALAIGFLAALIPAISKAYTYIPPSHGPITLGTMLNTGINRAFASASIDYCTSSSCSVPTQLSAMIHCNPDDLGGAGSAFEKTGLFVTDGITIIDVSTIHPSSPYWTWINSPSSWPYGAVTGADVVIGNGSTLTEFLLGVIYTYDDPSHNGYAALDIYTISNPGGTLTVTYNSTTTLSTNSNWGARIDMIPDYNNLLSTGKPKCDRFVATWEDITGSGVLGYSATLSNPTSGTSAHLSIDEDWMNCDIAGIQRSGTKGNQNFGLYTFWDPGTNELKYEEWNITTNTVSAPVVLASHGTYYPRIDAIDNPSLQAVGNNNWVVAAMDPAMGSVSVYSDAHPSGLGSIPVTSSPGGGACAVAFGPGSSMYTIGSFDIGAGNFLTNLVGISASSIGATGFIVNSSTANEPLYPDCITLSSTCNTDGDYIFAGWRNVTVTSPNTDYFYCKTTGMPISFKQPTAISNSGQSPNYSVYPNPVINLLTLSGKHNDGDSYSIIDVSGRVVMTGSIISDDQLLNVNNLVNGMYILNIITSDKTQKVQFVKE